MPKWLVTQRIDKEIIVEAATEHEAIKKAFASDGWDEEPTTQVVEQVEEEDV